MKNALIGLILVLMIAGTFGLANASTVIFLDDFSVTNDTDDVVHLGDGTYSNLIIHAAQGQTKTFQFDLSDDFLNSNVFLTIKHHQVNTDLGYYNHIFINSVDIGSLSDSTESWFAEQFQVPGNILNTTGNTLTINAYSLGSNYDDFEFTNLKLESVPIPGAVWLLGSGLLGLIGMRKRIRS